MDDEGVLKLYVKDVLRGTYGAGAELQELILEDVRAEDCFRFELKISRGVMLLMYESKNSSWVIFAICFCWIIWFIWYNAPEDPDPIKQYEEQIGYQYDSANDLLRNTVDELLEWNFNEPLSDADEDYLFHLLRDFSSIKDLFFGRYDNHFRVHPVYPEWHTRMEDIDNYLVKYGNERTLTYEEVTDLYQA